MEWVYVGRNTWHSNESYRKLERGETLENSSDDDREDVEDNEQYNWHFWDSALRKYENYEKMKYENTVKFRDIHQMVVWFLTITIR